jgi:hypothetical protein
VASEYQAEGGIKALYINLKSSSSIIDHQQSALRKKERRRAKKKQPLCSGVFFKVASYFWSLAPNLHLITFIKAQWRKASLTI